MAAVVRVKRRLDEEPLDLIVLNCKKRKTCGNDENEPPEKLSAVLQFAGTLKEEENIRSLLKKHNVTDIEELKEQFKKHPVNITEKIRSQIQENSKNNRFKVVNCFRSKNLEEFDEVKENTPPSEEKPQFTIFDIETDCNENDSITKNKNIEKPTYVYDLYYTNSDDFGDAEINEYISVHTLNDPLVFGSVRDNGLEEADSDDSEDSNAECNWRNDYPDESDMESVNEGDMIHALEKVTIDDDLLSSDEGEEKYVYDDDEEEQHVYADESDVSRYGKMYAKFKAQNKNIETTGLGQDLYYGDIDEEEYYY